MEHRSGPAAATRTAPDEAVCKRPKRQRAAQACERCRFKKYKCDELYPCSRCKSKKPCIVYLSEMEKSIICDLTGTTAESKRECVYIGDYHQRESTRSARYFCISPSKRRLELYADVMCGNNILT